MAGDGKWSADVRGEIFPYLHHFLRTILVDVVWAEYIANKKSPCQKFDRTKFTRISDVHRATQIIIELQLPKQV